MNGELAAIAAIASHGSPWLADSSARPAPELLGSNICFQYVRRLDAQLPPRGLLQRTETAHGTAAWLDALRVRGVNRLVLVNRPTQGELPPHIAASFVNSGGWGLLATGAGRPLFWKIRWDVGAPGAPDTRVWDLTATWVPGEMLQVSVSSVDEARSSLKLALQDIAEFAHRAGLVSWVPIFTRALAALDDAAPSPPYYADMFPSDASLPRRQLAAAAIQGWVFGGMGSWNDMVPADRADESEYKCMSQQLYGALLVAISTAANSA